MEQDNYQLAIAAAATAQQVQQDGQDPTSQAPNQGQKLQEQTYFHQQDVRMKRHPELQPFVPSDRFTTFSNSSTAGSGTVNSNTNYHKSPSTNNLGRQSQQQVYNRNGKAQANSASLASGQAKKYVSMTRLNQLAQPKKRLMVPSAPQSSNSSNKSINTLNRTINKAQGESSNTSYSRNDSAKQQAEQKAKQRSPQPPPQTSKNEPKIKKERVSLGSKAIETKAPRTSTASSQADRRQSIKSQPKQQQQPAQSKQTARKNSQPSTPIVSTVKLEPSTMMTPSLTTDLPSKTPQSSTPIARAQTSPRDHKNTPVILPPPTLTPGVSEEERSLIDNLETDYQYHDDGAAQHQNHQLSARKSANESSLAEQISEVSINDPFYQSAASELVSESENSTNGINFDRNTDSLFREIEQDLIAMRAKKDNDSHADDYFQDYDRRNSAATVVTESPTPQQKVESKQKEDQEEDDRRIRIEKELREKARVEEEERKERDQIVENILSRFSQGSVS